MSPLSTSKTARRREELRRNLPKPTVDVKAMVQRPEFVNTALVMLAFLAVASVLVIWAREEVKVRPDQIMVDTRVKRLDYSVPDVAATEVKRAEARKAAPHVYDLNTSYLDQLAASLNGLPLLVKQKTFAEVIEERRDEFQLTDAGVQAIAPFAGDGETAHRWQRWVEKLTTEQLPANPLMKSEHYQDYWSDRRYSTNLKRLLVVGSEKPKEITTNVRAIEILPPSEESQQRPRVDVARLQEMVLNAMFPPEVAPYIVAKLAYDATPTFTFNTEATDELAAVEAETVKAVKIEHQKGEILYRRGNTLTPMQFDDLRMETEAFAMQASVVNRWLPRVGVIGLTSLAAAFLIGYVVLFYPRVARNPLRILAICALMAGMLAITAMVGVRAPKLAYLGAVAPTVFVAIVALLAYDQRIALFLSGAQAALATLALEHNIGMFVLLFTGCGVAIAQLREMRHRSTLIRSSAVTGLVLVAGGVVLGVLETPLVEGAWRQILFNGLAAGGGGIAVGFIVLGILPTLERWFDITTGMTLAELRDPKQALLRQLQQKAPGTYNHSLQVANIAEAAAEAIGANSLLVYVGALYHDIGKMNKPEYFVENQPVGTSKHEKLSPAMSLLVIVGHVKDGIELAREYGLPRQIQHCIESHHGTTLVEYFYHAAREQAENEDRAPVAEIEYRYPGPKPRTKEGAILMLADAVESATRTMAEPNPARIEGLVRALSRKRLTDGQFDQCDLTFRELGLIEEATIRAVCAIYHARISYPSQKTAAPPEPERETARTPDPMPAKQASA